MPAFALKVIRRVKDIPLLGVCLGHQAIGQAFGGRVIRAPEPMHGKLSPIMHTDKNFVLMGLPSPYTVTRYHSLIVERATLPNALIITAETDDGIIMGLSHKNLAHPWHSISSGKHCHGTWACIAKEFYCVSLMLILDRTLSEEEMAAAMTGILDGNFPDARIAAFLTALHQRGETIDELTGAARAFRARGHILAAPSDAVDCCGTGGDSQHTYNISTAVALVAAACGVPVAKTWQPRRQFQIRRRRRS